MPPAERPIAIEGEQRLPWRVSIVVASVTAISIAVVLGLGWWATSTVDRGALDREIAFAQKGLQDSYARVPKQQESSAVWDEAVVRVKANDQAWMQENLGEWMGSYFGHNHVFVLSDKGVPVHAMKEGKTLSPTPAFDGDREAIQPLVTELRNKIAVAAAGLADSTDAIAGLGAEDYVIVDGRPAIVSVKPIVPSTPETSQTPGSEYFHVAVRFIDQRLIDEVADQYQLAGARFVPAAEAPVESSVPVVNAAGAAIGYLTWEPYRPGLSMVEKMAPIIAVAAVLVGILLVWLLRLVWTSTRRLHFLAFHDSMTGLPNRALFNLRMRRALNVAQRSGEKIAIMMIDLDRFKNVNDTLGHPAGDELIRQVSERFLSIIERSTTFARLGGDEFAMMLTGIKEDADAEKQAERILLEMHRPFVLAGEQVVTSVSIGTAILEHRDEDGPDLLRKADIALYEAKSKGRQRHQIFFHQLSDIVLRKRAVELDIRAALENGTFIAAYQPVFDVTGGAVVGAEALMRWQHPVHADLAPEVVIAIAEERGLIDAIGERLLEHACALLRETSLPWIALNISPLQLRNEKFVEATLAILNRGGVAPTRLQIEIKESVLMERDPVSDNNLQQLRASGIKIALDNFGTGYSSLNYLRQYPVDKIKIDRSLIAQLTASSECDAIVQAIVALAKSLKKQVAAEGVETRSERERVTAMGFDEIQGFGLSKPLSQGQLRSQFDDAMKSRRSDSALAG